MNRTVAIRQQLVLWTLVLALWALLVLAFAGQLVFTTQLPWMEAMRLSLRDWFPWALLAPLVDRKSTRLNSSHSDRSRMPSSA